MAKEGHCGSTVCLHTSCFVLQCSQLKTRFGESIQNTHCYPDNSICRMADLLPRQQHLQNGRHQGLVKRNATEYWGRSAPSSKHREGGGGALLLSGLQLARASCFLVFPFLKDVEGSHFHYLHQHHHKRFTSVCVRECV